jgi:hypothetical protein
MHIEPLWRSRIRSFYVPTRQPWLQIHTVVCQTVFLLLFLYSWINTAGWPNKVGTVRADMLVLTHSALAVESVNTWLLHFIRHSLFKGKTASGLDALINSGSYSIQHECSSQCSQKSSFAVQREPHLYNLRLFTLRSSTLILSYNLRLDVSTGLMLKVCIQQFTK